MNVISEPLKIPSNTV